MQVKYHGEIFSTCTFVHTRKVKKKTIFVQYFARSIFLDRNNYYFRYNCADVISSLVYTGDSLQNSKNICSPGQRYRRCRSIYRESASREHIYSIKSIHSAYTQHAHFLICFRLIGPVAFVRPLTSSAVGCNFRRHRE